MHMDAFLPQAIKFVRSMHFGIPTFSPSRQIATGQWIDYYSPVWEPANTLICPPPSWFTRSEEEETARHSPTTSIQKDSEEAGWEVAFNNSNSTVGRKSAEGFPAVFTI